MQNDLNKELLKILPFYDSFIDIPRVKKLINTVIKTIIQLLIQLLKELSFYNDLSIIENKTAFSGYAQSYKVEIVDKKDVIVQLESSEISIKDLFKDLLIELKGFKYQLTLNILLSKQKSSNEIEYRSVYFNSLTKTIIYHLGSTYCKLPKELSNSKKGLINIQNNDNKCFFMMSCQVLKL